MVTSPVGANCIIVDHGLNGYLANSDSEWIQALTQLRENPELRAEMGNRGALKVQKHYSLQSVQDKFIETLRN